MMTATITNDEAKLAQLLGEVWNTYGRLPKEHPTEQSEFCAAIHACQNIVLARAGRRALSSAPEVPASPICRGDYGLGTACGTCSKCFKFDPAKGWKLISWNSRNASGLCSFQFENWQDELAVALDASNEQDAWKLLRQHIVTYLR